jgi:hypothetical protein
MTFRRELAGPHRRDTSQYEPLEEFSRTSAWRNLPLAIKLAPLHVRRAEQEAYEPR